MFLTTSEQGELQPSTKNSKQALLLLIFLLELLEIRLIEPVFSTLFQALIFPPLSGMTSISFSYWLVFKF
jgi:hypothetical protein